jgi:hypothetical protein
MCKISAVSSVVKIVEEALVPVVEDRAAVPARLSHVDPPVVVHATRHTWGLSSHLHTEYG